MTCPTCGVPGPDLHDQPFKCVNALIDQRKLALDLLAWIHRDGGHYAAAHGFEKACRDARDVVLKMRTDYGPARR